MTGMGLYQRERQRCRWLAIAVRTSRKFAILSVRIVGRDHTQRINNVRRRMMMTRMLYSRTTSSSCGWAETTPFSHTCSSVHCWSCLPLMELIVVSSKRQCTHPFMYKLEKVATNDALTSKRPTVPWVGVVRATWRILEFHTPWNVSEAAEARVIQFCVLAGYVKC